MGPLKMCDEWGHKMLTPCVVSTYVSSGEKVRKLHVYSLMLFP